MSTYAVIKSGGKQYRVSEGLRVKLEKIEADEGSEILLNPVLLVSTDGVLQTGQPHVEGAAVKATILRHGLGKKIQIIKFRRRKHYMRKQGHRQPFTEVKIESIQN